MPIALRHFVEKTAQLLWGLLSSSEQRFLFAYRRWASERAPYRSQHGQDWWVDCRLREKRRGFFLDLAAADGGWISNTHFLEKVRGWSGVCIEPNSQMFAKLQRERQAHCVERCISDRREPVTFLVDAGVVGGIVAADTDNKPHTTGGTLVTMEACSLTELLDELSAPQFIDYFSLDVEGSEDRVIRGLDLQRYRFGLITVERPSEFVDSTLRANGYVRVRRVAADVFYENRSLKEYLSPDSLRSQP
jgi:FkbM family methyltransferase